MGHGRKVIEAVAIVDEALAGEERGARKGRDWRHRQLFT